jgi:cell division septation protein DedD
VDPAPYFSKDLPGTSRPAEPNDRVVIAMGANRRVSPDGGARLLNVVAPNSTQPITGWRHGTSHDGTDVWFEVDGYGWSSAAGFTSRSVVSIKNKNPAEPEPPVVVPPVVETEPVVEPEPVPDPEPESEPAEAPEAEKVPETKPTTEPKTPTKAKKFTWQLGVGLLVAALVAGIVKVFGG